MPYDEHLADRIRASFREKKIKTVEKKMMGGLCFMVKDKMCVGIMKGNFMARIDPEKRDEYLKKKGCRVMDFTARPMKGIVLVEPEGIDFDKDLEYWINICLEYNPKAKSSKK